MESMYVTIPEPNKHYAIVTKDHNVVGYQSGIDMWFENDRDKWLIKNGYQLTEIPAKQVMDILMGL